EVVYPAVADLSERDPRIRRQNLERFAPHRLEAWIGLEDGERAGVLGANPLERVGAIDVFEPQVRILLRDGYRTDQGAGDRNGFECDVPDAADPRSGHGTVPPAFGHRVSVNATTFEREDPSPREFVPGTNFCCGKSCPARIFVAHFRAARPSRACIE